MSANNDARRKWHGGNWIIPARRLGIYLRDGLACVWCGHALEDGAQFSLDHLRCNVKGGGNESTNLVTACTRCNSARAHRSVAAFARAVAEYLDDNASADAIIARVRAAARRKVKLSEAKELLARRGGMAAAMAEASSR